MKIVKRIIRSLIGVSLIVLAIVILNKHYEAAEKLLLEIEQLPDYDYVSEIKSLIKDKRYGEAIIHCEDVQNSALPCSSEIAALKAEAEKESKNIWNRIYKVGKGFVTGNPDNSIEEIGGSIASDMVMYGDIRDLIKQGWYKITNQETDPLLAALAGVGLLTEFVDIADWTPSVLKALKKAGAISRKMADSLFVMCKNITKTRKVDESAKAFFGNTKKMVNSAGFIRTKNIFTNIDSVDDLAIVATKTTANPSLSHLVAKHSGKDSIDVMKKFPVKSLKYIARKGRPAIHLLKTYHKHKPVIQRNFWKLLLPILGISGLVLLISGITPFFFRKRKNSA